MARRELPSTTSDGRYIVVRGRLWRRTNPHLDETTRTTLTRALMRARRGLARKDIDDDERRRLRLKVDRAKRRLGERGPVWWTDGAPDFNRHLVRNTPYAGHVEAT